MMKNIKTVLGPNPLLWCWPTVPPGDGLNFEIVQGNLSLAPSATLPILTRKVLTDGEYTGQWPPEDPATFMDENHVFTLPKDPWTYGNGSFNPDLHTGYSNRGLREHSGSPALRQRHANLYPDEGGETGEAYAVPPYHPDYDESRPSRGHLSKPPYVDEDEDDHYYEDGPQNRQFIRRGSEGYEVHPIDREEMMRQYVESQSHLTAFARAQGRADQGEESDNYGVSDGEDGGENRVREEKEMERDVRERLGEAGRYRPYLPERCESEDEEGDEPGRIPNDLPVQG